MSKCPTCLRSLPKTCAQRNKFHSMCRELGKFIGLTPGKVKEAIKSDYYGLDEYRIGDKWYRAVKPSEQSDREEYSELIDYTMVWAVENCGFVFEDRK